jgi:uncharacterized repeat protein (TIGR01451 family)
MKPTNLSQADLSRPDVHRRLRPATSIGLRVGAILILAGLVVSSFYSSSSASQSGPTMEKERSIIALSAAPTTAGSMRMAEPVLPASRLSVNPMPPLPQAGETVATYASDCTTPKTAFVVGDTVCVVATGVPISPFFPRRLAWATSDSTVVRSTDITSDPQIDSLLITPTTLINGQAIDNRGTWQVAIRNPFFGFVEAITRFTVTDPVRPTADLALDTTLSSNSVGAGSSTVFGVQVTNYGPDSAANVTLTDAVPANATFNSFTQTSGPTFTCTNPTAGGTGTTSCVLASMNSGDVATFLATYDVNAGTPAGTLITNTADVASVASVTPPVLATDDENPRNNSTSASTTVTAGGGTGSCTLDCPDNITAIADTTEGSQRGTHVTFDAAEPSGDCGAVTAAPASGSFFPVGTTVVSVTSETGGGSCSFTVTVEDQGANPPTISCPANKEANADSSCSAVVNVGTASATGNNVTVIGTRSDGKPMYSCDANGTNCTRLSSDAPFSAGVTTITWKAYSHDAPGPYANPDDEEAHRTGVALCTQTVTVNDVTPPTISVSNQTASADENCMAPVPDYSTLATVSDNCACASSDNSEVCDSRQDITITQSPAAGTMVGLGPHNITLTANDGSSNNDGAGNSTTVQTTFTVNDTTPPAIHCPGDISVDSDPGVCSASLNPGTATATDNCDSSPTITASRSDGKPLTDPYPVGTTTITWTATDDSGNHSSCTQTVVVVDTEPPVIVFNGQTPSMWPPNHKYSTFQVTNFVTSVTDNCSTIGVSSVVITKVTSDEIENGNGDGNTLNDIVIAADCKSVQLRSEREGNADGRVYTIFFSVRDTAGNVGTGTAKVIVRHNPGETAVDSGPHYTVTSICP